MYNGIFTISTGAGVLPSSVLVIVVVLLLRCCRCCCCSCCCSISNVSIFVESSPSRQKHPNLRHAKKTVPLRNKLQGWEGYGRGAFCSQKYGMRRQHINVNIPIVEGSKEWIDPQFAQASMLFLYGDCHPERWAFKRWAPKMSVNIFPKPLPSK